MVVFEMSTGQMVEDVRLAVEGRCEVSFYGRPGGVVATPEEIARVSVERLSQEGISPGRRVSFKAGPRIHETRVGLM